MNDPARQIVIDEPVHRDEALLLPEDTGDALTMGTLFEHAARVTASDLLITAGAAPMVRVDGLLYPVLGRSLDASQSRQLILSLLNQGQQDALEQQRELDFSLPVDGDLRFRANIYFQRGSVAGAFRLIPNVIPTLKELGLPDHLMDLTLRPHGLILITGSTGSGKSTTQASIIDLINQTRRCHIVTVEDPIEFLHENKHSVIDQREVYDDTLSFGNALKYVLRQDPDVILVGEMRDMETISAVLTAAETGHLVIATLHTNDAIQTIDRIVDVFPPHQHDQIRTQLASTLLTVVCQQLIPRATGVGRVLATEVLVRNHAVAAHIREAKTHLTLSIMESNRQEGMMTMDQCLEDLYREGHINRQELARRVTVPAVLESIDQRVSPPIHGFDA